MATNPFINPFNNAEFDEMFWHWLLPFTAWLLRIHSFGWFFIYNLFFSFLFVSLTITLIYRRLNVKDFRSSLLIFALLPVSGTTFFWVGYDGLTLAIMTAILMATGYLSVAFIGGMLLGIQHFEQGILAAMALLIAIILTKSPLQRGWPTRQFCFALVAGIVTGKLILYFAVWHLNIHINSGEIFWWSTHMRVAPRALFYRFAAIIFSLFGIAWLVFGEYISDDQNALAFSLGFVFLIPLLLITTDETRVFAIVTWPLVLVFWLQNPQFLQHLAGADRAWLFLTWLIVPWPWITVTPTWSAFPYDLVLTFHRLFGWFAVPADLGGWPLRS